MARDILSEQQMNIKFVKAVQNYPSLYNFELPSYSRKDVSDKAWEDVGRAMNMTPSACRERWRNLRAVFMRTMKAPAKGTGKKKPYYLADVMQFVVPFMRPLARAETVKDNEKQLPTRQTNQPKPAESKKPIEVAIEQIKVEQGDEDSDETSTQSNDEERDVTHTRKRSVQDDEPHQSIKVVKLAQPSSSTMIHESEHVKSFLNSLLPELNEMSSTQFKNFKRQVLLLIDDIMTEIPASPRRNIDESEYII